MLSFRHYHIFFLLEHTPIRRLDIWLNRGWVRFDVETNVNHFSFFLCVFRTDFRTWIFSHCHFFLLLVHLAWFRTEKLVVEFKLTNTHTHNVSCVERTTTCFDATPLNINAEWEREREKRRIKRWLEVDSKERANHSKLNLCTEELVDLAHDQGNDDFVGYTFFVSPLLSSSLLVKVK